MQTNYINIEELFIGASKNLNESLEKARKQYRGHSASIGEAAESAFRDFLERRLPKAFAVGEGFIFEAGGKRALQQDIVIYDNLNHPKLVSEGRQGLYPIDTVAAIFEVKSNLDRNEISDAVNKIVSVKKLKRSVRNQIPGTLSGSKVIPLRGYIFAYGTRFRKTTTIAEYFVDEVGKHSPELRPDFMVVNEKWWFDWIDDVKNNSKPWDTPKALRVVYTKEYSLLQVWTRLMEHLTWYHVPTPLDWIAIPGWGKLQFNAEYLKFGENT